MSAPALRVAPLWGIPAFVVLAVAARCVLVWQLPFPQCWLRKLTGIPCPTCGCTRSLAAWTRFDFQQALVLNPLFFTLCALLILWVAGSGILAAIHRLTGKPLPPPTDWRAVTQRWPVWKIAFALLALNWLYLCLHLPH